jgi:hypothetical protein
MTQTTRDFVQMVRLYIRDFPELNRIVKGEESSDRQIGWATLDAIADFNGTPHFTMLRLEDLLMRNQHALILRMTVISLIESIGLLQTRNHINYADADELASVLQVDDRADEAAGEGGHQHRGNSRAFQ